jgi:hypothetical protein
MSRDGARVRGRIVEWRRWVDRAIVQAREDGRLYQAHHLPEGAQLGDDVLFRPVELASGQREAREIALAAPAERR